MSHPFITNYNEESQPPQTESESPLSSRPGMETQHTHISRYKTDFDELGKLGQGGFGVNNN